MSSAKITIVGSVNMDLVFRTPRMPEVGETIGGHEFLQIHGGKGGNQAVAAARQGAQVRLIARIGDDGFGQELLAGLQGDGIDTRLVAVVPGVASGVAGILVDDDGQNSIVLSAGANARLLVADIDAAQDAITTAQYLVCQLETPLASVERAIDIAHQAGVPVIFNPTPMQELSDALLAKVSYLVVNEVEAGQLSGLAVHDLSSAQSAAQLLLTRGAGTVLLTLGAQGVLLAREGVPMQVIPAFEVEVVDTTAAGDTFVGSLAVALGQMGQIHATPFDTAALAQACTRAQAAAALCVTRMGAQSAIPQGMEVDAFLVEHGQASVA